MEKEHVYKEELSNIIGLLFDPIEAILGTIPESGDDAGELANAAKSLLFSAMDQLDQLVDHIQKETGQINIVCDRLCRSTASYNKILGVQIERGLPPLPSHERFRLIKETMSCISPRLRELLGEADRELSRVLGEIQEAAHD